MGPSRHFYSIDEERYHEVYMYILLIDFKIGKEGEKESVFKG
jgi:hypothetical protein